MILAEMVFQKPCRTGALKLLISWTRGNQIVSLQIQVILEAVRAGLERSATRRAPGFQHTKGADRGMSD